MKSSPWSTYARLVVCQKQQSQRNWTKVVRYPHNCALCVVIKSKAKDTSCVVTLQYDNSIESWPGVMAESLHLEHCKNFWDAATMNNCAHQSGNSERAPESQGGNTIAKLAEVWYEWRGTGRTGSVLKWCLVEDQIVVD